MMGKPDQEMRIVKGKNGIKIAAAALRSGDLAAFPTETVYGLGADATSDTAVAGIYEAKGRPKFNPLIIHASDKDTLGSLVKWNNRAEILADAFWPGPLTLVLPRAAGCPVSLLASAGLDTLGVRLPSLELTRLLLQETEFPIAAPSANKSGHVSPTSAEHVATEFGEELPIILDGGRCKMGLESTVIDLTTNKSVLMRPGIISQERLQATIGAIDIATSCSPVISPGMMDRHYAPSKPLRLNALTAEDNEILLGFGPNTGSDVLNLSVNADLVEAASNLFSMLRELEQSDHQCIAVMPIPRLGLGAAINDRLKRAATFA